MKNFRSAFIASSFLLAACPPPGGNTTEGTTDSESEGESSSSSGDSSLTQSSTPSNPTEGTEETSNTTMGVSESESQGTDTTATMPSTDTSSTGPGPVCTADTADDACDAATPFCVDDACVNCSGTPDGDAACGEIGDAPYCLDGECVKCTDSSQCDGSAPVCDPASHECVGCGKHADCPASSCNFETGACNPTDYTVWVDKLAADCVSADGTMSLPYCSVTEAITNKVATDLAPVWTVKIRANNYIETPLVLPDGVQVTMSGWDGVPKLRATDDSGETLKIGAGSKVYLDRLSFNSNDSFPGVTCGGGVVRGDDVRFAGNKQQGYNSTECTSEFHRSVFFDNDGGGVASYGGTTTIVNSYISGNGTQNFGEFGGIRSAQMNQLTLLYSTVINNLSMSGPRSLHCTDDSTADIRNSVIIAFALPSVDCLTGTFNNSVLDEGAMDGDTNMSATFQDIAVFFDAPTQGIYKVKADAAIKDFAMWKNGDPDHDFDLEPRPNMDGMSDWPGADVPSP